MNFPCYYKEGFTPQSGIDTITIWLHPAIIDRFDQFHERGINYHSINLRYKRERAFKTNTPIRTNCFVDIQAEAINPNNDILYQVLNILVGLTNDGILSYQQLGQHPSNLMNFYYENFHRLFALDALDFYFDIGDDDMRLLGTPNPNYPTTRYSSCKPSILKAYSRTAKLMQKRNIPNKDIEKIDFPNRIEFSLRRDNCDFLNAYNLTETFEDVFLRYLPFLARKWQNHRYEVVEVEECNLPCAHHLRQVIAAARQRIPQYKNLLPTPPKPIPYKKAKKYEIDYNFIPGFFATL